MIEDPARPSPLSGLWTAVAGAPVYVLLLLVAHPITRVEDCSNYGAAGNASAFANSSWDLWLPLIALGWLLVVLIEQALPVTWRHRGGGEVAVRALTALVGSLAWSCCLTLPFLGMCH
ncbi:hypothetical protein [Actinoplanes sp. N902-109]|uniref:hypothetical protein n=1 Tax=Actinoplanes sp. (strain N902-109) TaxID=649831 RepID=UPI0012F88F8D|nr:hypothetical protein [Actinoplanes sp. N902-109]